MSNGDRDQEKKKHDGPSREQVRERARWRSRVRFAAAWVAACEEEDLARKRARAADTKRVAQSAAWEQFMHSERQELELRKDGQLVVLLGEQLSGELPAALLRLASEDQKQATVGLVALMSGGNVSYKHIDELRPEDVPARNAANRLRTTWLKERRDGWLGHEEARP
ncbi:MAG: hypothetical protein ACR2GU_05550 [Rubrobacteraceae bacterium]